MENDPLLPIVAINYLISVVAKYFFLNNEYT